MYIHVHFSPGVHKKSKAYRTGAMRGVSSLTMERQRSLIWVVVVSYVLLAVGIGVKQALPNKKPPYAERSYTMAGETAAACGFLLPDDTRDDRAIARGWRSDCGIFPPSVARDGPMGSPPPAKLGKRSPVLEL
jgi:hypothetical protein